MIRRSRPVVFCKKDALKNFAKFIRKHLRYSFIFNKVTNLQHLTLSKKRLRHRCFLLSFVKLLITPFLKNTWDGCFCVISRSVYCPTTIFHLFKNDVTHIFRLNFPTKYFLGLICRLRTRVSSIFQPFRSHYRSKIRNE